MTNGGSNPNDVFEVKKIRKFIELMKEHDLAELDLRQGEQRIRIRRGGEPVVTGPEYRPMPAASQPSPSSSEPAKSAASDANLVVITSPMVGTFYAAANPDSPAFVKVGDHVAADTTVGIIEAMKVFNEIPAETSGQIVAVLVENGAPVEYQQPLFKVDPRK